MPPVTQPRTKLSHAAPTCAPVPLKRVTAYLPPGIVLSAASSTVSPGGSSTQQS
jgi:hypothetical protein